MKSGKCKVNVGELLVSRGVLLCCGTKVLGCVLTCFFFRHLKEDTPRLKIAGIQKNIFVKRFPRHFLLERPFVIVSLVSGVTDQNCA